MFDGCLSPETLGEVSPSALSPAADRRGQVPARRVAFKLLSALIPRDTITVRERRRLQIIHRLCSGSIRGTARDLGHVVRTVRRWCQRGTSFAKSLAESGLPSSSGHLERLLLACVADAPRAGGPCTYTPEQQCAIIGFAVRKPADFNLPIEKWSNRELALVAEREGIAPGISRRTVGRILEEADLKPHRIKYS